MRVLLIKPYQKVPVPVHCPPLGLLYLTSMLRERFGPEVEVRMLDMKAHQRLPSTLGPELDEFRPDVVGVSALNCEARASKDIATLVKAHQPKTVTVLGGPYPHNRCEELLGRTDFDWAFSGPADRVFPDALERRFGGGDLGTDLPGFSYKSADGIHVASEQDSIADLDSLPLPAWDLIDFDLYARQRNMMSMLKGKRYAAIFTSRGCPYLCNYCHDLFGKRFVHRSAENVLEEIELLHERYGVDEIEVADDIFNLHKPRLKKIMGEVARRWPGKIHFCFPNGLRADILDDSVLDALQAGGAYGFAIAIETVTPRLQKLVEKNLDVEKARWAIEAADRRGMMMTGFFMLGFPTETREEIQATVDFALRSRLTVANFFSVIPQPATPLYALAEKENPTALETAAHEEEEGNAYRSVRSWYERAYGFPLGRFSRWATLRFYLRPSRWVRILRRVPLKSLPLAFGQFWEIMFRRPEDGTALRPE